MNEEAMERMHVEKRLEIVPGATLHASFRSGRVK
jgi:hypothetical protein